MPIPDPIPVMRLERIAALGWTGTTTGRVGGWQLRAGGGFTGRANSVLPLGDPGLPLAAALDAASAFYAGHELPVTFQIPQDEATDELDAALSALGARSYNEAVVLTADLGPCDVEDPEPLVQTVIADSPSTQWLSGYHYRGAALPSAAPAVLRTGGMPVFLSLQQVSPSADPTQLAVARAVVHEGWLGITAVTVDPDHRRRGLGARIMAAAMRWGAESGAAKVYVQVDATNSTALALYSRLGFAEHHRYHYRRVA